MTIASTKNNDFIWSTVASFSKISPGRDAPSVIDIRFARTENDIILGIDDGLNQLLARIEGEFRMNILPTALKAEPTKHRAGSSTYISVRSHTPAITRRAPKLQPILMPNLSRTRLAGKAKIGWTIGNSRVLRVTTTAEK